MASPPWPDVCPAARVGTTLRLVRQLRTEIGSWLRERRADTRFARFAGHFVALEQVTCRMLDAIERDITAVRSDQPSGVVYERCRAADSRLGTVSATTRLVRRQVRPAPRRRLGSRVAGRRRGGAQLLVGGVRRRRSERADRSAGLPRPALRRRLDTARVGADGPADRGRRRGGRARSRATDPDRGAAGALPRPSRGGSCWPPTRPATTCSTTSHPGSSRRRGRRSRRQSVRTAPTAGRPGLRRSSPTPSPSSRSDPLPPGPSRSCSTASRLGSSRCRRPAIATLRR